MTAVSALAILAFPAGAANPNKGDDMAAFTEGASDMNDMSADTIADVMDEVTAPDDAEDWVSDNDL